MSSNQSGHNSSTVTILSIDGGGIRGIVPLYLLNQLENHFRTTYHHPDFKLSTLFNVYSGTSTGAIITSGLSIINPTTKAPLYDTHFVLKAYLDAGSKIFRASSWESFKSLGGLTSSKYSSASLEKYFGYFFKDYKMSDFLYNNLIVAYDLIERKPFVFTGGPSFIQSPFKVKDALRATTSAPIYFKPSITVDDFGNEYQLIDGGVVANSSALVLLEYLLDHQLINSSTTIHWLSLGTGYGKNKLNPEDLDGAFTWLFPLLDILNIGTANNVNTQVESILKNLTTHSKFIRINPELIASDGLDDISPDNVKALQASAQNFIDKNPEQWNQVIQLLTQCYHQKHD
jgi:patatin-like phospholipase/acyl hydrolase